MARPEPPIDPDAARAEVAGWPTIKVRVPPTWKTWLEEAADLRAMSVAALVRQCVRDFMIRRHEDET